MEKKFEEKNNPEKIDDKRTKSDQLPTGKYLLIPKKNHKNIFFSFHFISLKFVHFLMFFFRSRLYLKIFKGKEN